MTGLAGARFTTTLEVANPGATASTLTIGLVPMEGAAAPAPVARTLAAGESLRVREALKTLFGLAEAAGTITVTSDAPLVSSLTTQNVAAPEGAYGLGLLPVAQGDLLGAGETGHAIWVSQSADSSTGYRTNLSVTLAEAGTVVEVRVLDAEGRVAGTATVTAGSPFVWQRSVKALAGDADLPVARAEFEVKAGRATAFAVVNDNVTSDAIALQAERVVPGALDRLVSGAALSPGLLGAYWVTDLRLFNPGSAAVTATILSVGAPSAASATVTVPAKGVVEVARVLERLGFPERTASALRVTATEPLLVAARTNNVDPAGVRKGTFSAQQFVTAWPAGLLSAGATGFFPGVDQTLNVPGVRTNLTLVGGPEGAQGELVLRDAAGAEQARTPFSRGAGEWGQLSVADWFGAAAAANGALAAATIPENARIDVSVSTGALDAFVSRIDNGSGDAVTRPFALPGGGDCAKVEVTAFGAAPQPILVGAETTFSWSVALDPPTAELTSQSIRFDGEGEVELDKGARSYSRSFGAPGARSATLTVRKGSCVKTRALTFFVCGELAVEPVVLPNGVAWAAYPARTLTMPGATAPVAWAVTSGALPQGLALSPAGELSGTPTEIGTFTFTARGTDANGCVGARSYTLSVLCPSLKISPSTLPSGTVGVPWGTVRMSVSGGSGSGSWSATNLPTGLDLTPGGVLSGTPTTAGSYAVTIRYADDAGCIGTASYTILVCSTLSVTPASVPAGTGGVAYGPVAFAAASASGAVTWSVTAGALPAGLGLDAVSGVLSGTPTAVGSFSFTVTATDSLGCKGSVAVTLVVNCPTITVNPPTLTAAFEDLAYTATLTQAGGTAGTTFAVTAGSLPAGFTLTPAGALSGTAAIPGTYDFTVTATDASLGCSGSRAYSFVVTPVNDAPSFTKGADVTVLEDSGAYSAAFATAISAGPADEAGQALTFNVTGNTNSALFAVAPAVSASGVLSFTPAANASGSATITLTLSDDGGTANGGVDTSAAQTFVVTVTDVNDAPSFTKGADVTVDEDSGAYSAAWATAIAPGPAPESGQAVTFNVTGNTNPSLFAAAPAVSPAGVLGFTPAANANGTATITVVLTDNGGTANGGVDTSAAQTFVVTVNAVNDAPSFTKGADVAVLEDSAAYSAAFATAISAGPADESAQTLTFNVTGNTNPSLFAVAPAVSASGVLSFTPAANASGSATITLTLSDSGGTANGGVDTSAAQTFTVTVSDVNDAPSFTKGADVPVLEDAGAQTVAGWATAISAGPASESGQTLAFSVTGNTNPALFAVAPAIAPNGTLTFTPAANANGAATITVVLTDNGGTANGGVDASAPQTFVVTVTAVNDAPSFTKGPDQTVFDNAGAQSVTGWATAISKGPADEAGQTVTFQVTGNTNPALFAVPPAIDASGTLTYTPTPSNGGTATITVVLRDDGGTANGGVDTSAPQTFTITFNHVNVAPSFTKGPDQTVNEDAGAQSVSPWATGISAGPPVESGQALTFVVTGNTNPTLFSAAPAITPAGVLSYTPAPNAFGTATITVVLTDDGGTANGGADASAPQTFVITVNAVNDAPSFTKGADQTVLEDAGAQTVSGWATGLSAGPANESGQILAFQVTGNTNPGLFAAGPAISPAGVLTYTPAANLGGTATITVVLTDDGGTANGGVDASAPQAFVITVTGINDAPSFLKGADQTVLEDAGPQTVNPWASAISAGPADESGQALTFQVTGNTNPTLFSAAPAISSAGVLTYTSAPNAFGTATITIVLSDNGGTANGGVDTSAAQSFVITVTPVNDPPTLTTNPVTYSTPGNTQLHVAGATLPGVVSVADADAATTKSAPADVDGPGPLVVVPASGASANGGSFAIAANGSFTYVPPAGFTGTDTFTYQVTDQDPTTPQTVTGTVSVTVGQRVWYVRDVVDANNAAGGDGRSSNAFDSIAAFNAATTNDGDVIFVFRGNTGTTALSGGFTLRNGQKLWGEGIGLTIAGFGTLVPAGLRPRISNGSGVAAYVDTASLPAGNRENVEIRGLELSGSAAGVGLLSSGASLVSVRVSENVVEATGGNGISAGLGSSLGQQVAIHDNTVTATGTGILVQKTGAGAATITAFDDNVVTGNTGGVGIQVVGAAFDAVPGGAFQTVSGGSTAVGVSGNGVGTSGIVLTTVGGDLAFTDLDVYAEAGFGLSVSSTGAVNVAGGTGFRIAVGAGVGTIDANGGAAVSIQNASANLPLAFLESTNSSTFGVLLQNAFGGAGGTTLSASSGQIVDGAGSTSAAVSITGGDGNVTLGIPITNSLGNAILVTGRTSGTISFTGAVAETGTGIQLTSNTGATISFSGGLTASTGANTAFLATGGGTVVVCDENPCGASGSNGALVNTLTTTTGTALNVANTTIGANDLEFRSISAGTGASGPTNGIVLDTTGAVGGLKVKGTGAAGSGGTIQRATGAGVALTNTQLVQLSSLNVQNGGDDGVRGSSVTGLSLTGVQVTSNGNAVGEAGIDLTNLLGTSTWTGVTVSGSAEDNVVIRNASGTLNSLAVTGSTFSNNSAIGNDGFLVEASGTASVTVSVTGSTFTANRGDHFQAAGVNSGILDVTFTGNTLTGGHATALGQGITINVATGVPGYLGTVDYNIDNNTINGAILDAIIVNLGTSAASSNMRGTISGNSIGTSGSFQSGSRQANGITVDAHGNGTHTVAVTNNTIRQTFDRGINVLANDGGGTLNITVTGNNVNHSDGANSREGFFLNNGSTSTNVFGLVDRHTVRLDLGGAGGLANTLTHGPGAPDDFRIRQRFESRIEMPGYGGSPFDTAAVVAYVQGRNSGSAGEPGTATANDSPAVTTDGFFNGTVPTPP